MTIGERIKLTRERKPMSQVDLAVMCGISKQTLYKYENNIITNIPSDKIELIAKALETTPAFLMGWETEITSPLPSNLIPLNSVSYIPLVGTIACGTPVLAEQNIERRILLPDMVKADFALRCKGNSMINAGIDDGDIAFIRSQHTVENGEIAAVQITDYETEATLKKVYISDTSITLVAQNPEYEPLTFTGEDMNRVEIVGKCVAVLKDFES